MKTSWRWHIAQQLEIKWWQNYLKDRSPDTYLPWKRRYWEELLRELWPSLQLRPGAEVLDAGCGPAGIFMALEGQLVTAIDPLLRKYKSLPHFQPDQYPNVHFKELAIENLKEEHRFDVVFCLNAINHVADIHSAYGRLIRALKPGGTLVVSIDAHNHSSLKHLFRLVPGDALHPHQYDLEEYTRFLEDRGLAVVQTLLKDKGKIFNYYVQVARLSS